MQGISYALFGANTQYENSFSFRSYMRDFGVNMRMAAEIFPTWKVVLHIDRVSYEAYQEFFDYHVNGNRLVLMFMEPSELCKMMLHRVAPAFKQGFDRIICRDADSLLVHKDAQAVMYWCKGGRAMHAELDSISHNIDLMGGMIGVQSKQFREMIGCNTFEQMLELAPGIDYNRKGADQDFLNRAILPKVFTSITQHYLLGKGQSYWGDWHNTVQDMDIGVDDVWRETNSFGYHLGASGFQVDAAVMFLRNHAADNEYYETIEKKFKSVFYWHL